MASGVGRDTSPRTKVRTGGVEHRKLANSRLPLALGAAAGLVVCALGIAAIMLFSGQSPDPRPVAQSLCDDLQSQAYHNMYAELAPRLQSVGTEAQFIASQQELDALEGKVTACAYTVQSANGQQASLVLSVVRVRAAEKSGAVRLARVGDAWKVDSYDAGTV